MPNAVHFCFGAPGCSSLSEMTSFFWLAYLQRCKESCRETDDFMALLSLLDRPLHTDPTRIIYASFELQERFDATTPL